MDPLARLVRSPLGWFVLNLVEYIAVIMVWRSLLPDDAPLWFGLVVLIGTIAGLIWINLRIARRFPRDG